MRQFKKLAGQTIIYGMGTIVPRFLNYVIMAPYFTRLFKGDNIIEYGKVTELYAYIAFLMVLLTYGMETTFFRFVQIEKDKKKVFSTIMTSVFITSFIFMGFIFINTYGITSLLEYEGESIFIRLLGAILAIEAITAIPFAKLRIQNRAKKFAILKLIQVIVNIGLMLLIYNVGPNVLVDKSYLLNDQGQISAKFIFVCNLLSNGVVIFLLTKEFRDYSIRLFDIKLLKPILIYGLPLMASQLGGVVNESLDRSVYKHIVSDKETGLYDLAIYGANYKIAGFIMLVIQMFRYAAEPFFFNSSKEKDSKQQFSKLMNLFVGVIVTMSLFILVFIDYFKILIDEDYHEGLFIVPYIVLSYVLAGILFNLSVWFKLSGKTHYAIIITLVGALITLLINFVYVPEYRYLASAYAHVIAYFVMVLISFFLGQKFYRIKYDVWVILGYLGLGIGLYKLDLLIIIDNVLLNNFVKLILVGLFAIFVAWKENILQLIMSKKDES